MPQGRGDAASKLPWICGALLASAVLAVALGWFLAPSVRPGAPLGSFGLWVLVALAILPMVVAPVVERTLPAASAERTGDPRSAAVAGKIAGFALREATALLGALITYRTGERLFVGMLGGLAILGMGLAWPSDPDDEPIGPS